MQFVYPYFLYALAAVSIPVIIHLFNFRRYKKIVFSDIRFLRQVQEETRSQQRIKELLILLCRILAIAALVAAFAQPFIPHEETHQLAGQKAVSIYIDNSFSMGNEGRDGQLLETARNKARGIIQAYGNTEQFQVLSNDFEGKQQRLLGKNDALQAIDEISIGPASKTLSAVVSRQKQAFEHAPQAKHVSYLISDFQKKTADIGKLPADSSLLLHFVPVQADVTHNLSVDSAWLTSPIVRVNMPVQLKVRIRNTGNEDAENIAVTLRINKVQKALVNLDCAAQSTADADFTFTLNTEGWQEGELSIIDNPVTFDDQLFFTIRPSSVSQILCINDKSESKYISSVFRGDAAYNLQNSDLNRIDYASFPRSQLIILNEPSTLSSGLSSELKKYVEQGGLLLVIPPAQPNQELNNFLNELSGVAYGPAVKQALKADHINIHEDLFEDVFQQVPRNIDLPVVTQHYELQRNSRSRGVSVMQLNNGQPFVYQASCRKGRLFMLTAPLDESWTNLPRHAVFVPMMLKLALGNAYRMRLYYVMDRDRWIDTDLDWQGTEKTAQIKGNDADLLSDVKQQDGRNEVFIDQQLKKAGIYTLGKKNDMKASMLVALNYKRDESYMQTIPPGELAADGHAQVMNDDATVLQQKISRELSGTQLWRLCVLLALVFVLIEILLLKLT